MLLLLVQLAYVPNAIVWSICYTLGPGFAFGAGTVVAPTGSALGPLPLLPMLAALPDRRALGRPGLGVRRHAQSCPIWPGRSAGC